MRIFYRSLLNRYMHAALWVIAVILGYALISGILIFRAFQADNLFKKTF